jgi:hypothetical protein
MKNLIFVFFTYHLIFFSLALKTALFFQNSSVTVMAVIVVIALYNQSSFSAYWMIIIQGYLIL